MLLHVRIDTAGGGPSWDAAERDHENKTLQKNRVIESLMDPSVDPSPDTRPTLTYCNRRLVYGEGKIQHIYPPLSEDVDVCKVCQANSATSNPYNLTYVRDDQTATV